MCTVCCSISWSIFLSLCYYHFVRTACSETGAKQWPEKEFLNPLKDPLPEAPSMRMYCMYGVGSPAERSYHYQHVEDANVYSTLSRLDCIHTTFTACHTLLCLSWLSDPSVRMPNHVVLHTKSLACMTFRLHM